MKKTLVAVLVGTSVLGSQLWADAQVPTKTWSIRVKVNPKNTSGDAWDPLGGAPDIWLCTSSSLGNKCVAESARCQDSFECSFSMTLPYTFTARVYDYDALDHDLIGSCYVTKADTYACGSATLTASN